jgi:hypothetical protein
MSEHFLNMVDFRLSIPVRVVETVINHPKLIRFGIDIDARDNANAANNTLGIATPLAADKTNFLRVILVQHRVIKENISKRAWNDFALDPLPQVAWLDVIFFEKIPNSVVASYLAVFGKVRHDMIDVRQE